MKDTIFYISITIGIVIAALANIFAIGSFLYKWGATDLPIAQAAWEAFVLWLIAISISFISFFISYLTKD